MQPKEDPDDKRNRLRERKSALLERRRAAEKNASGLATDLNSVYGLTGIPLIGAAGTAKAKPAAPKTSQKYDGIN